MKRVSERLPPSKRTAAPRAEVPSLGFAPRTTSSLRHRRDQFFPGREDLAAGPVAADSFEEPSAAGKTRPWLRRRASWALLGTSAVVAACATLAVSRADHAPRSLPQPTASQQEPTPTPAPFPAPAPAAEPAVPPPSPRDRGGCGPRDVPAHSPTTARAAAAPTDDAAAGSPATAEAAVAPADDAALDACKNAYHQHRASEVVSTVGRRSPVACHPRMSPSCSPRLNSSADAPVPPSIGRPRPSHSTPTELMPTSFSAAPNKPSATGQPPKPPTNATYNFRPRPIRRRPARRSRSL